MAQLVLKTLSSTLAVALLAAPALPGTWKVAPRDGTDVLQAAIDAAAPGDTILLAAGRYRENVVIPEDKPGLILVGTGARIDARASDGSGAGPALIVQAAGVTLRGLTFLNAADLEQPEPGGILPDLVDGIGVSAVAAHGLTIEDCDFRNLSDDGIYAVDSDGVTVRRCSFLGIRDDAIVISGNGARVLAGRILSIGDDGVEIDGSDALVQGLRLRNVDDGGIHINGSSGTVQGCTLESLEGGPGIRVIGQGFTVRANRLTAVAEVGIAVFGSGMTVQDNRVSGVNDGDEEELAVGIHATGDSLVISGNTVDGVQGASDDEVGILISYEDEIGGLGATGVVQGNTIRNVTGVGLMVDDESLGMAILDNRIETCQEPGDGAAVEIDGSGHLIRGNRVRLGGGDGFEIQGFDLHLEDNLAVDNAGHGFVLRAVGLLALDNRALDNAQYGFLLKEGELTLAENLAGSNAAGYAESRDDAPLFGLRSNQSDDGTHDEPVDAVL